MIYLQGDEHYNWYKKVEIIFIPWSRNTSNTSPEVLRNKLVHELELAKMRKDCYKNLPMKPKSTHPSDGPKFVRTCERIENN